MKNPQDTMLQEAEYGTAGKVDCQQCGEPSTYLNIDGLCAECEDKNAKM